MTLQAFIDIRFADPVMCLSLNSRGLAYGSALGRILYHNLLSHEEVVISEFSEECIRGIHLSVDNSLYVAVGDLHCISVSDIESTNFQRRIVGHSRVHNDDACNNVQILMHEDAVLILETVRRPLEDYECKPDNAFLTRVQNENYEAFIIEEMGDGCVPLDFNGSRCLWVKWTGNNRTFFECEIATRQVKPIKQMQKSWGIVSHALLSSGGMIVVKDFRRILMIGNNSQVELGRHSSDIVAIKSVSLVQNNADPDAPVQVESQVIVSVDYKGVICLWDYQGLLEKICFADLDALTPEYQKALYFSMGYPYFVDVNRFRIAVSTDFGVLVIKSRYLESLLNEY